MEKYQRTKDMIAVGKNDTGAENKKKKVGDNCGERNRAALRCFSQPRVAVRTCRVALGFFY
jgi:hypothetical protein